MQTINNFLIRLVLLPAALYRASGINVAHLKAILSAKLVMDERRPNSVQAARTNTHSEKEISNATLGTILISLLMGATYLFVFAFGDDYVTQFTLYFALFMVFLCMSLVSDFTQVLIDVRDTYIILPRPVNDATVVTARLLHVFIYILKMVLPMTVPCLIYLLVKNTLWSGLVFMVLVVFATLFAIFLINAVYLFILRFTTPDRFKNIIGYVQIVFAVTIMAGYQLLPRMMDWTEEFHFSMSESWWYTLIPPYWFGVAFNTLTSGGDGMHWFTGALAFLVPPGCIVLVVKYLAPNFVQRLAMISGADAGSSEKPVRTVAQREGYSHFVANLVTRGSQERAGFLFTWKMMLRSREFKLKVYPSIGYMLLLIIGMIVRKGRSPQMEADTFHPVLIIYLSSFLLVNVLTQINYSEKYRASWMFFITPLEKPGLVISGAAKAAILQLFTLLAGICIVLATLLSGYKTLPNLGLALSNQLLINFLVAYFFAKDFPFSQSPATQAKGGQFVKALMLMVVSALIGLVHYLLFKHPVAIAIGWVVSISGIWLVIRALRNTPWKNQQIED